MVRLRGTSLSLASSGAADVTAVAGTEVAGAAVGWGAAVGSSLSPLQAAKVNSKAPASDRTIPARRSFGITVILPCIVSCAPGAGWGLNFGRRTRTRRQILSRARSRAKSIGGLHGLSTDSRDTEGFEIRHFVKSTLRDQSDCLPFDAIADALTHGFRHQGEV